MLMENLRELMLLEGVSGYEGDVAKVFKSKLLPNVNEVRIDKAGNVIGFIKGKDENAKKVMVFAHLDSPGFIIRKIENSGLLQVDRLGGIPEKVLPALALSVGTINGTYVDGIFAVKAHHVTPPEEKYKVDLVTNLYVDIGATSKEQVQSIGIRVGCPCVYKPNFTELLGTRIYGTAVDNRGGCATLIELAELLKKDPPKADVYIVGSVWEEFNLRGAMLAARTIKPDFAICLDVTLAGDTPDLSSKFDVELGGGPAVGLYNFHGRGTLNGTIAHKGLYMLALKCAAQNNLPLQEFSALGMLTDNAYVQFENDYVACLDMGFPARYTHSPIECCDVSDLEALASLVAIMIMNIDDTLSASRY